MARMRNVVGKSPDLIFQVTEDQLTGGQFRTTCFEGKIRYVAGRGPHSGYYRSAFDHHGHLIADQFGGPGDAASGNIVAMHGHANNGSGGEYKQMEDSIKQLLGDRDGYMKVEVGYQNLTEIRPYVFHVQCQFDNGMHSRWRIFNFYPHMPNPFLAQR